METMIVEIMVPAISKSFDFQIPAAGIVRNIAREIIYILEQTETAVSFDKDVPLLCHLTDGRILNPDDTMAVAGVIDGNILMLV